MGLESYTGSPAYWFWDPVCCRNTLAWIRRHWAISLHLLLAIAVAGIAFSFLTIRQSAPSQLAFTEACSHPAVSAILGTPVRQGLFVTGMVDHVSSGQYADLRMSLYGPNGQGVLYANAVKMHGVWELTGLDLTVEGRPGRLNLLPIQSTIPR